MDKQNNNSGQYAIEMDHVSKIYKLKKKDGDSKANESFYALKDITLKIKKGDVVGILGTNGSGKSTLSIILSGISDIDGGKLSVHGEQELISINTGLNNQLTGLENIYLKGALLGFNKKKTKEIVDGVIEFAELGDFLYQPVKKYSSGMKSRLGFSISLALDPDIFIVDEALSVGDKGFAKKCLNRMKKLREEKDKTILFISHSLPQVREFCRTGLWIEGGRLMETGPIDDVCNHYSDYVEKLNALPDKEKKKALDDKFKERLIVTPKKTLLQKIFS